MNELLYCFICTAAQKRKKESVNTVHTDKKKCIKISVENGARLILAIWRHSRLMVESMCGMCSSTKFSRKCF